MRRPVLAALAGLLVCAPGAHAKSKFVVRGAGYGHGVGMSQFGAYGFAQHGFGYAQILGHYYTGTALGALSPAPEIRVLLQQGRPSVSFSGATKAGPRKLDPATTYSVVRAGVAQLELRGPSGETLATYESPMRVDDDGSPLVLRGTAGNGVRSGSYRGALEFRTDLFKGVNAINALPLEDYVRGVVGGESPSSWPAEALKAQAVAARTYAITTNAGGASGGFQQYADTRSQVYRGMAAETASTDAAVAGTAGQVVTYAGKPVVTYFFSTSGGETENVENVFIGSDPKPWLKGVDDPYDDTSPKHRWGPTTMTAGQAKRKLAGLVNGGFRGIKVLRRGVSPRVVRARVLGTRGATSVTGPELRKRLGLFDTWAYFKYISSNVKHGTTAPKKKKAPAPAPAPGDPATGGTPTDGTAPDGGAAPPPELLPRAAAARASRLALSRIQGAIVPALRGARVKLQTLVGAEWVTVGSATIGRGGHYAATLPGAGLYRIFSGGIAGPAVRAR